MKTEICFTTNMDMVFDNTYSAPRKVRRLGEAIEMAKVSMKLHDFTVCDIIDASTGEVLVIVTNTD